MNHPSPVVPVAGAAPSQEHCSDSFRQPAHDVALLAVVQFFCFLLLSQLEPRFFMIHLYQMIPYAAIALLVGCSLDRWAYAIGALVSAVWLALAYFAGLLGLAIERLRAPGNSGAIGNFVAILAIATALVAVLMIALFRVDWIRHRSEWRAYRRILYLSLASVTAYYLILLRWFWDMISNA